MRIWKEFKGMSRTYAIARDFDDDWSFFCAQYTTTKIVQCANRPHHHHHLRAPSTRTDLNWGGAHVKPQMKIIINNTGTQYSSIFFFIRSHCRHWNSHSATTIAQPAASSPAGAPQRARESTVDTSAWQWAIGPTSTAATRFAKWNTSSFISSRLQLVEYR